MQASNKALFAVAMATTLAAHGATQVQANWLDGEPSPGPIGGIVCSTRWDPDGAGPAPELIVVGGNFSMLSRGAKNLLAYEPTTRTWSAFAAQPDAKVMALTVLADGRLAVGGIFTHIGAAAATGLALFDGSTWTHLPFDAGVYLTSMVGLPGGDLVIGGSFPSLNEQPIVGLARWDGTQWSSFPSLAASITTLALRANGNLLVSGSFPGAISEWTGNGWLPMLPGTVQPPKGMIELSNGDVMVGGIAGGVSLWNGSMWAGIGGSLTYPFDEPRAFVELPNGDVLAAGINGINGVPVNGVARWDGSTWTPYAPGIALVEALYALPNGDLLATVGTNTGAGLHGVRIWDGTAWSEAWSGFDERIEGAIPFDGDHVALFGRFGSDYATGTGNVAFFDGTDWTIVNRGGTWQAGAPVCGARDPATGALWLGLQNNGLLRYDDPGWTVIPVGGPRAMAFVDGELIVGTASFSYNAVRLGRLVGTQLQAIGGDVDGPVYALLPLPDGDLIVGGDFLFAGGVYAPRIARWDGTTFHPLGWGLDGPVRALTRLPNGDLVAGGSFWSDGAFSQTLAHVARWDGTAWHPFGAGVGSSATSVVNALQVLPGGDLVAGGAFALGNVARWNGSTWAVVDGGADGEVRGLALGEDLLVVGDFGRVGTHESAHFARLRSAAPASADRYGTGCATSSGTLDLAVQDLPWLGTTYRARCADVGSDWLGLDVYGLAQASVPLASVLPIAGPGCDLLTTPEFVVPLLPIDGRLDTQLPLPDASTLLGFELFHQVAVLEFAAGVASSLSSSNGLRLTLGSF
ncbi:MAG: hypothetical protein R3F29_04775 [Planctomycetota bacterium]